MRVSYIIKVILMSLVGGDLYEAEAQVFEEVRTGPKWGKMGQITLGPVWRSHDHPPFFLLHDC